MTKEEKAAIKNVDSARVVSESLLIPVASVKVFQKSSKSGVVKWSWKFMLDDEIQFDGHEDKETEEEAQRHAMKMCGTAWNIIIKRD